MSCWHCKCSYTSFPKVIPLFHRGLATLWDLILENSPETMDRALNTSPLAISPSQLFWVSSPRLFLSSHIMGIASYLLCTPKLGSWKQQDRHRHLRHKEQTGMAGEQLRMPAADYCRVSRPIWKGGCKHDRARHTDTLGSKEFAWVPRWLMLVIIRYWRPSFPDTLWRISKEVKDWCGTNQRPWCQPSNLASTFLPWWLTQPHATRTQKALDAVICFSFFSAYGDSSSTRHKPTLVRSIIWVCT